VLGEPGWRHLGLTPPAGYVAQLDLLAGEAGSDPVRDTPRE